MTVKGNQPSLERDIAALFPDDPASGDFPPHHVTFDRGHRRNEILHLGDPHVAGLDFPGVYQAFRIHRQIYDLNWNPARKPETVHGITSLTAWQANPADVLAGNRGHWQVENREHYVRDKTFDEDRSQVRTESPPQFLATARNIAISLLRLAGCVNIARRPGIPVPAPRLRPGAPRSLTEAAGKEVMRRTLPMTLALLEAEVERIAQGFHATKSYA